MADLRYLRPAGVHEIPENLLDLRPDSEVEHDLLHPPPIDSEKNVFFFWHSGYTHMHPYTQRNVRAWHRRLSKLGWTIRVIDRMPASPLNVENFLDVSDTKTFPQAFVEGRIGGEHAAQHTSDLVRFPLLLKYGGVYADVGMMQIGDLDRLWNETIANPDSPYEVLSYNIGGVEGRDLTNYFLAAGRNNPYYARCHRLLLALWAEDGGKASTEGMHASALLKGVPLMEGDHSFEEDGRRYGPEEGQAMTLVMGLIDPADSWNGPEYTAKHIFAMDYMVGSQLINEYTAWNGPRAFELMSLPLPSADETETADQQLAREIVEACLRRSFGFKLAHGLILRVLGPTLGSLWRAHEGSDDVGGTYAHWLRYGMIHWTQDELPAALAFEVARPLKRGALLGKA
ncbi:hypothetical protein LTR53_014990 [Teratosphaeriaceae sp. CCFEE 6253]|nr:hypothetical protein LTR53_014990 [Teratosphaeriaceae sp. CCFEE 6253]